MKIWISMISASGVNTVLVWDDFPKFSSYLVTAINKWVFFSLLILFTIFKLFIQKIFTIDQLECVRFLSFLIIKPKINYFSLMDKVISKNKILILISFALQKNKIQFKIIKQNHSYKKNLTMINFYHILLTNEKTLKIYF